MSKLVVIERCKQVRTKTSFEFLSIDGHFESLFVRES